MPPSNARPSFYDAIYRTAEQEAEAASADGVDDEVGLLRAKIKERMSAGAGDIAIMFVQLLRIGNRLHSTSRSA